METNGPYTKSFGRYSGASSNACTFPVARSYKRSWLARAALHSGSYGRFEFVHELSQFRDRDLQTPQRAVDSGERLGALMYESHASYSACGLGSDPTDTLVNFVRRAGPESGLYGAKITGGGRGGTVAILGRPDAGTLVRSIADRYARKTGHRAHVFDGSSSGATACGVCEVSIPQQIRRTDRESSDSFQ